MGNAAPATATASVGFPKGAEGVTPPTNPEGTGGFLSDVIVEMGLVDRETVERAVAAAREPGRTVDHILLEAGALTEEQLSRAIAERYGFDHVDLDQFEVDMGAAGLISRSTASRYRVVPIAFATDGALIVAVADPVDALAISDVEVMTKSETRRAVASGSAIDALAARLPEVSAPQPAANRHNAASSLPPPSPNSQPSPSAPASEAPGDPKLADGSELVSALENQTGRAALEAELAEAHDALREQAGQAEAERGRLREQVMKVAQECDGLREAAEQLAQDRDRLSEEAQQRSAEFASLREDVARAESLAEEAAARTRELEDADRRAEAARLALAELREESERELEQSTRRERKLRDELTVAEERSAALERRLSGLMAAAAEAKAKAQELMALHAALAGDDLAIE